MLCSPLIVQITAAFLIEIEFLQFSPCMLLLLQVIHLIAELNVLGDVVELFDCKFLILIKEEFLQIHLQ